MSESPGWLNPLNPPGVCAMRLVLRGGTVPGCLIRFMARLAVDLRGRG